MPQERILENSFNEPESRSINNDNRILLLPQQWWQPVAEWVVKQGIAITVLIVAVCYLANENRTTVAALTQAINNNSASHEKAFLDLKAAMIEFKYELKALHGRSLPPPSAIPKIADGGGGGDNP